MRLISRLFLAGVGTVALAGTAYAADRSLHREQVTAPDGAVVQVRYAGDAAPEVAFVPVADQRQVVPVAIAPVAMAEPMMVDFDRMAAAMDQQMAAMMNMASAMPAMPVTADGKPDLAALKSMPGGGAVSYSYYSSTGANGCTQTVQMTSTGNGAQPKVIRASSGDCGTEAPDVAGAAAKTASTTAPAQPPSPVAKAPRDPRDTI